MTKLLQKEKEGELEIASYLLPFFGCHSTAGTRLAPRC